MKEYLYTTKLFSLLALCGMFFLCLNSSCQKFLDAKPDKTRDVPTTLSACQALLDNYAMMNTFYPSAGEAAADNYWLTTSSWNAQNDLVRDFYIWGQQAQPTDEEWANPYQVVFTGNEVLDILEKNQLQNEDAKTYQEIKGAALFYRGYAFFQLAQIFSPAYSSETLGKPYGVSLRLSPDLSASSTRSTVGETYTQIISDLQNSVKMLPRNIGTKQSRPGKAAAYGALARTYMAMEDYIKAGLYADSALQINHTLLKYKDLNSASSTPFPRFNSEVVFQSSYIGNNLLTPSIALIDMDLYNSYNNNDLRKSLFFIKAGDIGGVSVYSFKGSYDGVYTSTSFNGIANDELFLIRAECAARGGKTAAAMQDLNDLLRTRWAVDATTGETLYQNQVAINSKDALNKILTERRKELIFRGIRWTDLKRLNKDSDYKITIQRVLNANTYTLPPNDQRYAILIPTNVLNKSGMRQNPR